MCAQQCVTLGFVGVNQAIGRRGVLCWGGPFTRQTCCLDEYFQAIGFYDELY